MSKHKLSKTRMLTFLLDETIRERHRILTAAAAGTENDRKDRTFISSRQRVKSPCFLPSPRDSGGARRAGESSASIISALFSEKRIEITALYGWPPRDELIRIYRYTPRTIDCTCACAAAVARSSSRIRGIWPYRRSCCCSSRRRFIFFDNKGPNATGSDGLHSADATTAQAVGHSCALQILRTGGRAASRQRIAA